MRNRDVGSETQTNGNPAADHQVSVLGSCKERGSAIESQTCLDER